MTWKPMFSWYWVDFLSTKINEEVRPPTLTVNSVVGVVPVLFLDYYSIPLGDEGSHVVRGPKSNFINSETSDTRGWLIIEPCNSYLLKTIPKKRARHIGYFLHVVGLIAWFVGLCGQTTVDYYSKIISLSAMQKDYNSLADELIRFNLHIARLTLHPLLRAYGGLCAMKRHFVYRSRRCTSPPASGQNVMDQLQAFITPTGTIPSQDYIREVGRTYCLHRKIYLSGEPVRSARSNKATCLSARKDGGFDFEVGFYSSVENGGVFVPDRPDITQTLAGCFDPSRPLIADRPLAESLFHDANLHRKEYISAFNTSVSVLLAIDRPLLAFSTGIPERGGKLRVPNIPEGYAQIVAKGIGGWGIDALRQLFPTEFNNNDIRMPSGGCYKSGDYMDSTSFIYFEAGRAAWDLILDSMPLEDDIRYIFKLCIRKLIGPHIMFDSSSDRECMRRSLFTRSINPLTGKFKNSVPRTARAPLIGVPKCQGSIFGKTSLDMRLDYPRELRTLIRCLSGLSTCLSVGYIISVRGVLMSYGIAVTALFILNMIPHWEMNTMRRSNNLFFCKGDDNCSRHPSWSSCHACERKKLKSGMKPHDVRKAYESTFGCLLAEVLYLTDGRKKVLSALKCFSPKILFPDSGGSMEFVTLPLTVMQELKELNCEVMKTRITSYILNRFKRDYDLLRLHGISVSGPNAIVRWEPSDSGIDNTQRPGLYSAPALDSDYPANINPYDYLVAKKVAVSSGEGLGFYRSKRITCVSLKNKLSSVPLISPYRGERLPLGRPSGGAQVVLENLERLDRRAARRFHVAIQHDYTNNLRVFEPVLTFYGERVFTNPYEQRCLQLNAETGDTWPVPTVRDDNGIISFHSDVHCLSLGYAPTSDPVQELSLEALSSYPQGIILDARNCFPRYAEDRAVQLPMQKGVSKIALLYRNLILTDRLHDISRRYCCVYYVVLEQPGHPELSYMNNGCMLLICRPQRNSLGADNEILAIRNLIRAYNPLCKLSVITKDRGLLERLLA